MDPPVRSTRCGPWARHHAPRPRRRGHATPTARCAFGMRRLSIIDVAGGHQPLSNEDGTLWLVANGEIYNYRELRARPRRARPSLPHRLRQRDDPAPLRAVRRRVRDAAERHVRVRAVGRAPPAPAHRRATGSASSRSTCWQDGGGSLFASEAKALLPLPGVSARARSGGAAVVPRARLRAGAAVDVPRHPQAAAGDAAGRRGRPASSERRYWRVPPMSIDRGAAKRLDRARARAARGVGAHADGERRADRRVPVRRRRFERRRRVHVAAQRPRRSRRIRSASAAARPRRSTTSCRTRARWRELFGTDHHEILVRPDVVALLPRLLWHMDEPIADTAFITTYLVSEFARRDVTVILSGVGGDELFGGYRRYLGNHYQALLRPLAGRACGAPPSALGEQAAERSAFAAAERDAARQGLPRDGGPAVRRALPLVRRGAFRTTSRRRCCAHRRADERDPLGRAFAARDQRRRSEPHAVASTRETQLPDDLLLLTDKMSMAVSLECRVPLLDHELVELAARMPRGREDARRAAQARAEGRARGRAAARTSSSARSAASARRWARG